MKNLMVVEGTTQDEFAQVPKELKEMIKADQEKLIVNDYISPFEYRPLPPRSKYSLVLTIWQKKRAREKMARKSRRANRR